MTSGNILLVASYLPYYIFYLVYHMHQWEYANL